MNNDIKLKDIIIYALVSFVIIIASYGYINSKIVIKGNFINNYLKKSISVQKISPERMYLNVWRMTRNLYADETLNNQDWNRWRNRYRKKIKTTEDAAVAINTMLASLNDPYTKFLLSAAFLKQQIILDSKITGIGILFNKSNDSIMVSQVIENSPAKKENINEGDIILKINGENIKDLDTDEVIEKLEKNSDKNVELTIKHGDTIITKKIKNTDIPFETMQYRITEDNIGIIKLSNIMGEKAEEDFKQILRDTNDTKGIILDLRNNYGGILANAVVMTNYMLKDQKIVSIKSRINKKYQIYSADEKIFKDKPIVIIINRRTASAAEIIAGSLRDNIKAVIIGENSFGKNSIQHIIPTHNGTGLILTTDKYILPNGEDIYQKGITPDIKITDEKIGADYQLEKAKEIINRL